MGKSRCHLINCNEPLGSCPCTQSFAANCQFIMHILSDPKLKTITNYLQIQTWCHLCIRRYKADCYCVVIVAAANAVSFCQLSQTETDTSTRWCWLTTILRLIWDQVVLKQRWKDVIESVACFLPKHKQVAGGGGLSEGLVHRSVNSLGVSV